MISFGKIGKLTDGIVDKVLESITGEGSELIDQLVQKVHKSGIVDDIIEEVLEEVEKTIIDKIVEPVAEQVIEQIVLALTGESVDIDVNLNEDDDDDEDEDLELNLSDALLPRTEELDDAEHGI
jgi:hypothetical protein